MHRPIYTYICICIAFIFEGTSYLFFPSFTYIYMCVCVCVCVSVGFLFLRGQLTFSSLLFLRLDIELPSEALGKVLNFALVATSWNPFMCEPYFGFLPFSNSVFRDDQRTMLLVAVNQTKDLENPFLKS